MEPAAFKPAVPKKWLVAIAGVLWSAVGIGLCRLAVKWLWVLNLPKALVFAGVGVTIAVVVNIFMFSRIANKNIARIDCYSKKGCVFAFQAWRSYLIIMVMIAMGIFLRHSAFPRPYLALLYTSMGGALFLASFRYYAFLWSSRAGGDSSHLVD